MTMDKVEYRAVIKFLVKKGKTPTEITDELTSVYGDSSPSHSTIKKWAAEFKRGRQSLEDDPQQVAHPSPSPTRTFALWRRG